MKVKMNGVPHQHQSDTIGVSMPMALGFTLIQDQRTKTGDNIFG